MTTYLFPARDAVADDAPRISVLIPVYNERDALPICIERVRAVLISLELSCQLVFVDDGSTDGSHEYLQALATIQSGLKIVRLSRNFGKEAAMSAGLEHCDGDATIILDADLQDPPELMPAMIEAWQAGADVVTMRRITRSGEPWHKKLSAYFYYRILNHLSEVPIPKDTGDFRLLSARAVQTLTRLKERSRYMKGLFAWIGYPTTELRYERQPRVAGKTKWGYGKLIALAFEGISSFSVKPLRWASGIGVIVASLGLTYGFFIAMKTVFIGEHVPGYPSLIAIIAFLGGVQLITMGILGEYVGKAYMETKQRPLFVISSVTNSRLANARASTQDDRNDHAAA